MPRVKLMKSTKTAQHAATTDPTPKAVGTKAVTLAGLYTHGK